MLRSLEPALPCRGEPSAPFSAIIVMQQPKCQDGTVLPQLRLARPDPGRDRNILDREQTTKFHARPAGADSEVTDGNIRIPADNAQFVRGLQFEFNLRVCCRKAAQPGYKPA